MFLRRIHRLLRWYWQDDNYGLVCAVVSLAGLVGMFVTMFLAPQAWWGNYSQAGVSIMDKVFMSIGGAMFAIIMPKALWETFLDATHTAFEGF